MTEETNPMMRNRHLLTALAVAAALTLLPVTIVAAANNGNNSGSNTEEATSDDIIQPGDAYITITQGAFTYVCKPSILNSEGKLKYNVPVIGILHFCDKVETAPPATTPLLSQPAPIAHTG